MLEYRLRQRRIAEKMVGSKVTTPDDTGKLGPAMLKLNDRQRAFVREMTTHAGGELNYTQAAENAGYAGDRKTLGIQGSRLAHDEKIRAAMLEEGLARVGAAIPVATSLLVQIATTSLRPGDRMKAIGMILNRAGMPEISKHEVRVSRELGPEEKMERALAIAKQLGIDPKSLGLTVTPLIEHSDPLIDITPTNKEEVIPSALGIEDIL